MDPKTIGVITAGVLVAAIVVAIINKKKPDLLKSSCEKTKGLLSSLRSGYQEGFAKATA